MNMTNEDVNKIEKFIEIRNRGFYCNGTELTQVYNKVMGRQKPVTNCSSCMRMMINELEQALNAFNKAMTVEKKTSGTTPSNEENNVTEAKSDKDKMRERMAKVRSHRKINNK